jgi:putative RecB family exonuclease
MSPEIYSHSKLSTFEQCPLKYKFKYIDKIPPVVEQSIESHLGKTVHTALEWLYTKVKEGFKPELQQVIDYYYETWQANYKPTYVIVKKQLTEKDYFNSGLKFIIDYYIKHTPFDDNTLELEKRIFFHLDNTKDYRIQGFIDRLVYNKQNDEYEIHDYKTSNSLPSQINIENDRQLSLYALAIKNQYKHSKPVKQVWHYLAFNKSIEIKKSDEILNKLKEETIKLIQEISNATIYPPIVSTLCHWCEFKPICPAWKDKKNTEYDSSRRDKQINLNQYEN